MEKLEDKKCKLIRVLIVTLSFLKIFELLRVTNQFGKNINLFFKSIFDMRWFMGFFLAWVSVFAFLYKLLGVKHEDWFDLIFISWEISIG